MQWLYTNLMAQLCLPGIEVFQLGFLIFLFGVVAAVAFLARHHTLRTLDEINSLKRSAQSTLNTIASLEKQIKHYHPDGTYCQDEECDHDPTSHT